MKYTWDSWYECPYHMETNTYIQLIHFNLKLPHVFGSHTSVSLFFFRLYIILLFCPLLYTSWTTCHRLSLIKISDHCSLISLIIYGIKSVKFFIMRFFGFVMADPKRKLKWKSEETITSPIACWPPVSGMLYVLFRSVIPNLGTVWTPWRGHFVKN